MLYGLSNFARSCIHCWPILPTFPDWLRCWQGLKINKKKMDVTMKSKCLLGSHCRLLSLSSKQSVPGESSTPLVRSSERLAAKRRTQGEGSLETLYFTPMMSRGKKHEGASQDHKLESSISSLGELTLDSTRKPSSSVRRRRTTQVINITMTKVWLKKPCSHHRTY